MNFSLDEITDGLQMDYLVSYTQLVLEQKYNDRLLLLHSIDEGTTLFNEAGEIISINEGFIENIAKYIEQMTDGVAAVIQKFLNGINNLINNNQKFLKDNANIILGNKVIDKGDTFRNYHDYANALKAIEGDGALTYKQESFENIQRNADKWQKPEDYIKDQSPAGPINYDPEKGNFKNQILEYFRGQPQSLQDKNVSLELRTVMHQFCLQTYNAALDSIDKDKNTIVSFSKGVSEKLKSFKDQNPQNAAPTPQNTGGATPQQTEQNAAAMYQSSFDYYFHEDGNNNNNNGNMTVTHDENKQQETEKKEDQGQKIANALKSYSKANNDLLSAKMTLVNEIYSKYLKILKWYVNSVKAGNKQSTGNVDEKDKKVDLAHLGDKLAQIGVKKQ